MLLGSSGKSRIAYDTKKPSEFASFESISQFVVLKGHSQRKINFGEKSMFLLSEEKFIEKSNIDTIKLTQIFELTLNHIRQ